MVPSLSCDKVSAVNTKQTSPACCPAGNTTCSILWRAIVATNCGNGNAQPHCRSSASWRTSVKGICASCRSICREGDLEPRSNVCVYAIGKVMGLIIPLIHYAYAPVYKNIDQK